MVRLIPLKRWDGYDLREEAGYWILEPFRLVLRQRIVMDSGQSGQYVSFVRGCNVCWYVLTKIHVDISIFLL